MKNNNRIATINEVLGNGKFISITLPEGLAAGTVINLSIDNGNVTINDETTYNNISEKIASAGYIKNNHLYRRWVMAQMFKMLEWNPAWTDKSGYDGYLSTYGYKYQFRVLENEFNALAHMEKEHDPELAIRSSFWTDYVAIETMRDHIRRVNKYAYANTKRCHNTILYKVDGYYARESVLIDKLIILNDIVLRFKSARTYHDKLNCISEFKSKLCKLGNNTPLCPVWKDAFKGAGAYYTLQNLIRYHGVGIKFDGDFFMYANLAENILEQKRREYAGCGYKMFYFMKDVIKYNDFDFKKRMEEIYKK